MRGVLPEDVAVHGSRLTPAFHPWLTAALFFSTGDVP
jgi:hypothetical protein